MLLFLVLLGTAFAANSEFSRCVQSNCLAAADKCLPECLKDEAYVSVIQTHPRCTRNAGKRITFPNFDFESYIICLQKIVAQSTNKQLNTWLNCELDCYLCLLSLGLVTLLLL